MSAITRQVRQAQRRLWLNRWLRQWGWALLVAIIGWTLAWIAHRLFALPWPMGRLALGGLALSLIASIIWLVVTREQEHIAAATLDQAAGLKERVSTGLQFETSDDPFARAVLADAERKVAGLNARKFIPVRWAGSLSLSAAMLVIALLTLLLKPMDLLGREESKTRANERQAQLRQVQASMAKPLESIKQIVEKNPELKKSEEFRDLQDGLKTDRNESPDAIRRDAIKKLDKLQDRIKQEAAAERYKALEETKKRLNKMGELADPKTELGKLMEALANNDFQEAQEQVKKAQEELAKRNRDGKMDPDKAKQMQQQLNELAKKLQEAANDKQSQQELQNAGMSKEEAKRTLEALAKADPKQLEKMAKELAERLKDKGVTPEQMKQMLEKMQQQQKSSQQCNKMGDKMQQAAQKLEQGDQEGAQQEMEQAGEMLDEMEQLEQSLNDLESQMSELDQTREELNENESEEKCPQCDGTGFRKDGAPCPHCNGNGQGQGGQGRGAGPRDRDDSGDVDFEDKKAKTPTRKGGRIVGQQFVKGRQLKGKSEVEFYDAASAAELDATDALNRDRVPRVYRKGVKKYFDRLPQNLRPVKPGEDSSKENQAGSNAGKKAP